MESNKCVYCGKDFVNKYTKKRHLVDQHGETPQVNPEKSISEVPIVPSQRCRFCDKVFTTRSNRKRHETTFHGTHIPREPSLVPTAIICKECGEENVLNFTSLGKYREHLQQHHGIPTRKVDYEFSSTQEFMAWKDRLEADLGVNYSKMRGVKKSSTGTRSTYYCRRSGLQRERVQASEAKRAKKGQGSCKLGLYCTSSMEVKRTDNDVIHVSLYTDHRDHDLGFSSLVHTTLTKSERERIAEQDMMESSNEFVKVDVKDESIDNQVSSSHLPSLQQPSGLDSLSYHSEDALSQCDMTDIKEEDILIKEEPIEDVDLVTGNTITFSPKRKSEKSSTSYHSEDALSPCDMTDIKEEDILIKEEPIEDVDLITGNTITFSPKRESEERSTTTKKDYSCNEAERQKTGGGHPPSPIDHLSAAVLPLIEDERDPLQLEWDSDQGFHDQTVVNADAVNKSKQRLSLIPRPPLRDAHVAAPQQRPLQPLQLEDNSSDTSGRHQARSQANGPAKKNSTQGKQKRSGSADTSVPPYAVAGSSTSTARPRPPRPITASALQSHLYPEDPDSDSGDSLGIDGKAYGWPTDDDITDEDSDVSDDGNISNDSDNVNDDSDSDSVDGVNEGGGGQVPLHAPSVFSFSWSDGSDFVPDLHPFQSDGCGVTKDWPCDDQARESDFFCAFLDEEVMSFIAEKTNNHHRWASERLNDSSPPPWVRKWRDTTARELYVMFALMLLMPLSKKHVLQHYWRHDTYLGTPMFNKSMPRDRFLLLLKFLHFADNENHNNDDQIWKVREILSMFLSRYRKYFYPFQKLVIDESLMLFKGRFIFKQYIPSKRHRFGIKLFVLCDCETGIVLDIIVYTGTDTDIPKVSKNDPTGMSGAIVKRLMAPYMGRGHILYTGNWYTSPALCQFLHDNNTGSCGTVRTNRRFMPKFNGQKTELDDSSSSDTQDDDATHDHDKRRKKRKTEDRYVQTEKSGKILALKYGDKRPVHLLSTVHRDVTVTTGKRDHRTKRPIKKPEMVIDYTQNMRLIDKCDSQLSGTECLRKSVKWYKKLFFHMIDITILNAYNMWLVLNTIDRNKRPKVREFQHSVATQLLQKHSTPIERPHARRNAPQPQRIDMSLLNTPHYPVHTDTIQGKRQRLICMVCRHTKKRPQKRTRVTMMCKECNVGLCVVDCFRAYHTEQDF